MTTQGQGPDDRLSERLPLVGLLAVQVVVGYEWLISGLTKIVRGGFPSGLADELTERSRVAPGWYGSFLKNLIIPKARAFGYLIEISELLVGVALIGGALIWLFAWRALGQRQRKAALALIMTSALAGAFMNVNFHLASGSAQPWMLSGHVFDESVDLDSLMTGIELAMAGVAAALLWLGRGRSRSGVL